MGSDLKVPRAPEQANGGWVTLKVVAFHGDLEHPWTLGQQEQGTALAVTSQETGVRRPPVPGAQL